MSYEEFILKMTEEEFEKLYFKAKLAGAKAIGELLMNLVGSDDEKFALKLIRKYSPGLIEQIEKNSTYISEERPCKESPYGLCYTVSLGKNLEQMYKDSIYCIWCDMIYSIDLTNPKIKYIKDGHIIDGTSMLIPDNVIQFAGNKNEN